MQHQLNEQHQGVTNRDQFRLFGRKKMLEQIIEARRAEEGVDQIVLAPRVNIIKNSPI